MSVTNVPADLPAPNQTALTTVQQKVFVVKQTTPESIGTDSIKKAAVSYFSTAGKVGAIFGGVKPEEISIAKQSAVFRPFWKITAGNAYRYARMHTHTFHVERDVESVVLMQTVVPVMPTRQLEEMTMERAMKSPDEYGAVEIQGGGAADVRSRGTAVATGVPFENREGEIMLHNLTENAFYMYVGKFLFDGVQGSESKEKYDLLRTKELTPVDEDALRGRGTLIAPSFTREQAVGEVSSRLARRPPEMVGEASEHQFVVGELSLIYIPYFDFTFEYKGKTRTARFDGLTGKMEET